MAKSGSFSKTFSTGYILKVAWTESNIDTANNQSDITVTVTLSATGSYSISSSVSKNISLTINGTTYSSTCTVGVSSGSSKTLMTKTVSNITHNSDGSKSVSISCTLGIAVTLGGSYVSSVSTSGTATLTTIARKSSLTANNGTLNTVQTLTVTRQDSAFTHTITYKCGTASGTIVTKSTNTSISWTPPLSLASQNTTGTSVSITFTITTYNSSGTSLGSNTKTITCSIPTSVKPSLELTVSDGSGYYSTYDAYIKGQSTFKITLTATTSYGSAIKSYKTTANGSTYTSASFTTEVLKTSGTLTISATITDARGRTATASTTVTVLDYSSPILSSVSMMRCNLDGSKNLTGEYLKVSFNATITSLDEKNTSAYKIQYKKKSDTSYTSNSLDDYEGEYLVSGGSYIFAADTTSSYDVILSAIDAFSTINRSLTGSSASHFMSWMAKGLGIAFGKTAELSEYFDVGWKAIFRKAVQLEDVLIQKKGHYVHTAIGTAGSTGYVKIAQITINGAYANAPITLELAHRGYRKYTLEFRFVNTDTTDPDLSYFYNYARPGTGYLFKSASGVWDLYIQKSEAYDNISVVDFRTNEYMLNKVVVTWTNEHADTLPDGYVEPTIASGTYDSGWQNPTFDSNFENYSTATKYKMGYRRIGNSVEIRGYVKPTTTVSPGPAQYDIFTLPNEYRPTRLVNAICQVATGSSTIAICTVRIDGDGSVVLTQCRENGEFVSITTSGWIAISIMYFVN